MNLRETFYYKLFVIPGAAKFSCAAFLGRLPAGMIGLAIVLPISKLTGSYMIAGLVAAFTMIGMALCAPLSGWLVDRYGQQYILLISAAINLVATFALIVFIQFDAPLSLLFMAGIISGASRLSTGTMARTRWAYVIKQSSNTDQQLNMLQSAYAFESIVDEVVFISAPILVIFLCTQFAPLAGLMACLLSYVVGAIMLAMQRSTQPLIRAPQKNLFFSNFSGLYAICAAIFFIGISAGAVEVIVVARADLLGSRPFIGLLMATLAVSSMLAGFWYGAQKFRFAVHTLWIRCLALLVLALVPFIFATSLLTLGLALFIAGILIAPTSIAGQVLVERILPTQLLTQGMSVIVTAMILGMAAGNWFAGSAIDKFNAFYAGLVPVFAASTALIIACVSAGLFILHVAE